MSKISSKVGLSLFKLIMSWNQWSWIVEKLFFNVCCNITLLKQDRLIPHQVTNTHRKKKTGEYKRKKKTLKFFPFVPFSVFSSFFLFQFFFYFTLLLFIVGLLTDSIKNIVRYSRVRVKHKNSDCSCVGMVVGIAFEYNKQKYTDWLYME